MDNNGRVTQQYRNRHLFKGRNQAPGANTGGSLVGAGIAAGDRMLLQLSGEKEAADTKEEYENEEKMLIRTIDFVFAFAF